MSKFLFILWLAAVVQGEAGSCSWSAKVDAARVALINPHMNRQAMITASSLSAALVALKTDSSKVKTVSNAFLMSQQDMQTISVRQLLLRSHAQLKTRHRCVAGLSLYVWLVP